MSGNRIFTIELALCIWLKRCSKGLFKYLKDINPFAKSGKVGRIKMSLFLFHFSFFSFRSSLKNLNFKNLHENEGD